MTTYVGSHDDNRILEIGCTTFVISQSAFVQDLQKNVESIGVCLFNLIEQDHRVRAATYGLGKLTSFVIAHISWRRSHESAYGMFLLIFTHINTGHGILIVKEVFGQGLGQFCLSDPSGSQEKEGTNRFFRILQARTATANRIGYGCDGLLLSYHTFV